MLWKFSILFFTNMIMIFLLGRLKIINLNYFLMHWMEKSITYRLHPTKILNKNTFRISCWLNPFSIKPLNSKKVITNKKFHLFSKSTPKMILISILSKNTTFIKLQDLHSKNLIISKKFSFFKNNGDKRKNSNSQIVTNYLKWFKLKQEKMIKNKKFPVSLLHLIK